MESSDNDFEFEGFSQNEINAAVQHYNDRVDQTGIGDNDIFNKFWWW